MIFDCPSCAAENGVPVSTIPEQGHILRCRRCNEAFRVFPPIDEETADAPAPAEPTAISQNVGSPSARSVSWADEAAPPIRAPSVIGASVESATDEHVPIYPGANSADFDEGGPTLPPGTPALGRGESSVRESLPPLPDPPEPPEASESSRVPVNVLEASDDDPTPPPRKLEAAPRDATAAPRSVTPSDRDDTADPKGKAGSNGGADPTAEAGAKSKGARGKKAKARAARKAKAAHDATAAPKGKAARDGTAAPKGKAARDGTAAPKGKAERDSTAAPKGKAERDSTAAPKGKAARKSKAPRPGKAERSDDAEASTGAKAGNNGKGGKSGRDRAAPSEEPGGPSAEQRAEAVAAIQAIEPSVVLKRGPTVSLSQALGSARGVGVAVKRLPLALKAAVVVFPIALITVLVFFPSEPDTAPEAPISIAPEKGAAPTTPEPTAIAKAPAKAPVAAPPARKFAGLPSDVPALEGMVYLGRPGIRIRSRPTNSASSVARLPVGAQVKRYDDLGGWTLVHRAPRGAAGFVQTDQLTTTRPLLALARDVAFEGCRTPSGGVADGCVAEAEDKLSRCEAGCAGDAPPAGAPISTAKLIERCEKACKIAFSTCQEGCRKPPPAPKRPKKRKRNKRRRRRR